MADKLKVIVQTNYPDDTIKIVGQTSREGQDLLADMQKTDNHAHVSAKRGTDDFSIRSGTKLTESFDKDILKDSGFR